MALGSLALPDTNVGFDAEGTAMVPVSAGRSKLGEIKIKSPLDTFKDTFFSMQESLAAMLGIQTKEAKRQAVIDEKLLAQKDFEIKKMNEKFAEENRQGPLLATSDDFKGVDTDKKKTNIEAFEGSALAGILGTLQESFDRVSFGEKMMAVILTGGLALFTKFREPLTKALTPIVQFVMDLVDSFGPGAVFAGFIGVMLAFKTGLAQFLLKFAAGGIIKGIALLGTKIKAAGGLMFLAGKGAGKLGDGIKAMNSGLKTVVSKIGSAGSLITKGLTKGFTMLGTGLKSLQIGIMSMSSSLGAMLVPFLPVIAIAAAAVAVFISLKSGFDVFKKSLDDGDSMFTAVLKGLQDAMLTLVTLPYVLVQKLVGFIAGLFGFDSFKEKLESFDIKEKIVEAFSSLTGGLVKILKAVAAGAGAALASVFKFKNPIKAFSEAYSEVMAGGEGKSAMEKADEAAGIDTGDGTIAEKVSSERKQKIDNMADYNKRSYTNIFSGPEKSEDFIQISEMMAEKRRDLIFQVNEADKIAYEQKYDIYGREKPPMIFNQNSQGDVYNQKSETNVTGDLEVNNTEASQRLINAMA